jgi:hypothetical protein
MTIVSSVPDQRRRPLGEHDRGVRYAEIRLGRVVAVVEPDGRIFSGCTGCRSRARSRSTPPSPSAADRPARPPRWAAKPAEPAGPAVDDPLLLEAADAGLGAVERVAHRLSSTLLRPQHLEGVDRPWHPGVGVVWRIASLIPASATPRARSALMWAATWGSQAAERDHRRFTIRSSRSRALSLGRQWTSPKHH